MGLKLLFGLAPREARIFCRQPSLSDQHRSRRLPRSGPMWSLAFIRSWGSLAFGQSPRLPRVKRPPTGAQAAASLRPASRTNKPRSFLSKPNVSA